MDYPWLHLKLSDLKEDLTIEFFEELESIRRRDIIRSAYVTVLDGLQMYLSDGIMGGKKVSINKREVDRISPVGERPILNWQLRKVPHDSELFNILTDLNDRKGEIWDYVEGKRVYVFLNTFVILRKRW